MLVLIIPTFFYPLLLFFSVNLNFKIVVITMNLIICSTSMTITAFPNNNDMLEVKLK